MDSAPSRPAYPSPGLGFWKRLLAGKPQSTEPLGLGVKGNLKVPKANTPIVRSHMETLGLGLVVGERERERERERQREREREIDR